MRTYEKHLHRFTTMNLTHDFNEYVKKFIKGGDEED